MRHLVALVGVLGFFVAAVSATLIWQGRRDALNDGKTKAELVARLAREQTLRAFQTTELVLGKLELLLEQEHRPPEHDDGFRRELQAAIRDLPHIRAIYAVAPDGSVIHDSNFPHTPETLLSDRDYFVAHKENLPDGSEPDVYVGHPIESRSWGGWFIPVSRRVDRHDGGFGGVIVAAVEPRYFEGLFRDLDLEKGDALALFNADGFLIARFPPVPRLIGRSWSEARLSKDKRLPVARAGLHLGESLENKPVIISYRRLEKYPVVAAALLGQSEVLARWRQHAVQWGTISVVLIALMLAFAVVLERHRRERLAAEARAFAIQRFETLGHMTSGIAHDFNNVLAVLAACLRLVRNGSATEQALAAGEQAIERGARLSSQLLSFAKRHNIAVKRLDIDQLIVALQPMLKQAAGSRCRVCYRLDASGITSLIDQAQFDAAMLNLVVNAAQAMNEGSIEISSAPVMLDYPRTAGLRSGRYVSVKVKDNGCGIPAEDFKRVFESFYTTKKEKGTGLGLAQVYAFMHYIHGDARIESELGVGTTIELLFPCL